MAAITEDYVSFETAKLLKEKGFPQNTFRCHYIIDGNIIYKSFENRCGFGDYDIIAPTLEIAMKWLREEHNIAINIGWGEVFEDKFQWWCIILNIKDGSILRESKYYATYEEACQSAIKHCLEHLI